MLSICFFQDKDKNDTNKRNVCNEIMTLILQNHKRYSFIMRYVPF